MIIDTSAIMAILKDEPENASFSELIASAPFPRMSTATMVELGIVIYRSDPRWKTRLSVLHHQFLELSEVLFEPVTKSQSERAIRAYEIFGKGSGHLARLNFGDCFACALAKELDEPLLFKGMDFIHTDVRIAVKTE